MSLQVQGYIKRQTKALLLNSMLIVFYLTSKVWAMSSYENMSNCKLSIAEITKSDVYSCYNALSTTFCLLHDYTSLQYI